MMQAAKQEAHSKVVPLHAYSDQPSDKPCTTDHIIDVNQLDFYYGDQQVLRGINLGIRRHCVTALIGASGSGKSTLLRTINLIYRLYPHQRAHGEIWFERQNILTSVRDINQLRAKIGMVLQKPTPFPMSIFDNIAFALKLHEKLGKRDLAIRVERALQQAALWDEVKDKLHKNAMQLSGGQQQRLCIARTIAINPQVILFDEPTAALDPLSTHKIEQLISTLAHHYTVVMVTHNLAQARRITDYTAYLHQGELIEMNNTMSFFTNPQQQMTADYIDSDRH